LSKTKINSYFSTKIKGSETIGVTKILCYMTTLRNASIIKSEDTCILYVFHIQMEDSNAPKAGRNTKDNA
jgi:hypothetical protein